MSKLQLSGLFLVSVGFFTLVTERPAHAQSRFFRSNSRAWVNPSVPTYTNQVAPSVVYGSPNGTTYQSYRPSYGNSSLYANGTINSTQPAYSYRQPAYTYQQPAYTYQQPSYSYQQPTYSNQPVYGQPVYGQPVYGQPVYGQPVYGNGVVGSSYNLTPGQARGAAVGSAIGGAIGGQSGANIGAAIGVQTGN